MKTTIFGQMPASPPRTRSLEDNYIIDFLSGMTAGALYHPFRVMADRVIARDTTPFQPSTLFKGMRFTLLSSHQLVGMGLAMSTFDQYFPEETQDLSTKRMVKAMAAGCSTTFTITPFDVFLINRANKDMPRGVKSYYRGFTPTFYRQGIVGLGLFVFPKTFDSEELSEGEKIVCTLAGSSAATLFSHVFDMSRVKMQKDIQGKNFPKFRDALWDSLTKENQKTVVHSLAIRFGIVAMAAFAMTAGREAWGTCLDYIKKGEES